MVREVTVVHTTGGRVVLKTETNNPEKKIVKPANVGMKTAAQFSYAVIKMCVYYLHNVSGCDGRR